MKIRYRCTSCNWRFARSNEPRLCPYCGKSTIALDKGAGAAEELLKEIEEMEQNISERSAESSENSE